MANITSRTMIDPYKTKANIAAKKAYGQLSKVMAMLEDDKYCMDILQQIRAVDGLLVSLSAHVLESHLHTCAQKALNSRNAADQQKVIGELITAFKKSKK